MKLVVGIFVDSLKVMSKDKIDKIRSERSGGIKGSLITLKTGLLVVFETVYYLHLL